jgi:divinyl chlorophyllide a 8-vinyl-reductase
VALVRDKEKVESDEGKLLYGTFFEGADVVECDVCDADKLTETLREISSRGKSGSIDTIISCLASRSGIKKDAYAIDYQATLNCLESGRAVNARHFVLLSAYCVKNPWLQFQQAKLKFEAALTSQQDMTYVLCVLLHFSSLCLDNWKSSSRVHHSSCSEMEKSLDAILSVRRIWPYT